MPPARRPLGRSCLGRVDEGPAHIVVADEPEDVVSRLLMTGAPEEIREQIRTLEARGIDSMSIISFGTTEVVQDTLRRFALDVMNPSGR